MNTPETHESDTPDPARPTSRWARARHRTLAPKRWWATGIENVERSMHAEQGDVTFAVTTLAVYLVQEVLSANGLTGALLVLALAGGGDLGIPNAALYGFIAVMILWAVTIGFSVDARSRSLWKPGRGAPSATCGCAI